MNKLFFGDCLDILKSLHAQQPGGFIDLIYIDPPFNSKRDYNILFESHDIIGDDSAQKQAFADTWSNVSYIDTLNEIQEIDLDLYQLLKNFDSIRISKSAVSYLTTMAIRIYFMHKVLRGNGTFYLHCDPTMSHYLKILCDLIFGKDNFRNEIVWCYSGGGVPKKDFARKHDIILRYSKSESYTFNTDAVRSKYSDEILSRPKSSYAEHSYKNNPQAKTIGWDLNPLGKHPDDWFYMPIINPDANERLGYPTQKPEDLLKKIIMASSNDGDLVADFFCGCGTTIAVAQELNRRWLGVDISHLAIRLVKDRLIKPHKKNKTQTKSILDSIEITGLPKDIGSARELAQNTEGGRLEFQDWIIEVMLGGVSNIKKTADGGYDGYLTFNKSEKEKEVVLIEVKSGNVNVKNIREFIQVVKSKKSSIGAFVCFKEQITKPMEHEAKLEGYYDSKIWGQRFPKIQILSVEDILDGDGILIPESTKETFKIAKLKSKKSDQAKLFKD